MGWSAALALAALAVRGAVDNPAALVVPPAHQARAVALVDQLGSRQFAERDRASRELEGMGRLALPAVRAGSRSADAEVRTRCDRLRPPMEAEELTARLGVFVADAAGRHDHAVPGWELFRAAAGDDRPARDLFAAVVADRANWPLLTALRGPAADLRPGLLAAASGVGAWADRPAPARAAQAAAVRRWEFFAEREAPPGLDDDPPRPRRPDVSVPDMALVVLAETLHTAQKDNRGGRYQIDVNSFLNRRTGRDALEGKGRYGPAFARLGRAWLDTRDGDAVLYAFHLARHSGQPADLVTRFAGRVLARRTLQADDRAKALELMVRDRPAGALGLVLGELHAPEPADPGLRDHLLAAAVLLTGQSLADFGLVAAAPVGQFPPVLDAPPDEVAERAAARRAAGYARWRDWEATRFGAVAGAAGVVGR